MKSFCKNPSYKTADYSIANIADGTGVSAKEIRSYCQATQRKLHRVGKSSQYLFTESEFRAIVAEIRYLKHLAPNRTLVDMVCPCPVFGDIDRNFKKQSYFTVREICDATGWSDSSAKRFCGEFLSSKRDVHAHHRFDEEVYRKIVNLFRFLRIVSPASPLKAYYRLKGFPPASFLEKI